jgi:hypothetical protein
LIRKEHVRCRYGVFKVRANPARARPTRGTAPRPPARRAARGVDGPRHDPGLSKLNSVRPAHGLRGARGTTRGTRVDVVLGEPGHWTTSGTSPGHRQARQPPE